MAKPGKASVLLSKRVALATAAILALSGADRAFADQAFCNAYRDAAMTTIAAAAGCGYGGPRWDPNPNNHYNACMNWGPGTSKIAITETDARTQDFSACKAKQAGVGVNTPLLSFVQNVSVYPTMDTFCTNYAKIANLQVGDNSGANCGYQGARWDTNPQHHFQACMGWGANAGKISAAEMNGRELDLIACRKRNAKPPPPVQTSQVPSEWADMLNAHNEKRKLHCAQPLVWSAQLAAAAQAYADKCILDQHGSSGENMADWVSIQNGNPVLPAASNTDVFQNVWYCEVANYNFNAPAIAGGFKHNCDPPVNGHFTQIVWKSTTQLGCGKATCTINGQKGTHWVCRYSPAGNDTSALAANVSAPTCH